MSIAHQISELIQEMANVKAGLELKGALTREEMQVYEVCRQTFSALKPLVNIYMDACEEVRGFSKDNYTDKVNYPNEDALAFGAGLCAAGVFGAPASNNTIPQDVENCQIQEFQEMMSGLDLEDN